ncbi:MAG: DNA polymerase I [Flavobacteriaceae bacterium]|nr:DNA polymerase I [Flavobacteriaceae bacterium]
MTTNKRLFLLDAYALIFRGYYAFIKNPRINSKGFDTSAIMGFTNSLIDVIKRERPDYLAVCFDKGGSKSRTELYNDYKANRDETPEAIKLALPFIQNILNAMHIPIIIKEGYEADDIIGTLAKKAEKEGFQTFMVTPDKDFAQLVSENIFMYRPARMGNGIEIWGIPEVQKKFEVERPEQVIDYLGMMGDSVDNIPGLPGVGDKTAKKFLAEFGSMENLLANTDKLKGKLKEKIEANKNTGVLSKELAKILLDVPVKFNAKDFELEKPDMQLVGEIFEELEFRRMRESFEKVFNSKPVEKTVKEPIIKKESFEGHQYDLFNIPGGGSSELTSNKNNLSCVTHFYQVVNNSIGISLLIEKLLNQKSVSFNTETTNHDPLNAELVGISFSWEIGKGYFLYIPENRNDANKVLAKFKIFFEHLQIQKIGHNLKYDIKVLNNYGVSLNGPLFDTLIAHYLINPDMRHGMDILAETYLSYQLQPINELIGKKVKNQQGGKRDVDLSLLKEYSVEDSDIALQLKQYFEKELIKSNTLSLYQEVEIPLISVLSSMECEGINLNIDFLAELSIKLKNDITLLEKEIFSQSGEDFNIASPKQLGLILFEKLKLVEKPKKTKTGQYSTSEDVLSYLSKKHKIISDILQWRSLQKLLNTYVEALPKEINLKTKRVHTIYNQAVASTGRLSSNKPNLQNIPIRTLRGQQIRKAFISRDNDHVLVAADYSQIELRIIAALSGDPNLISAFKNGEDIHKSTAAKVFNISLNDVSREQRNNAKTINFGIIYGVSAFGLSQQTNLSRSESKELIEAYYLTYPKLRSYMQDQIDYARENGYVSTVLGRRRYLKDINSANAVVRSAAERNAVNAPIQGSAADIIKLAMINIHKKLISENWRSKMLLQVHDELVFDVLKSELKELKIMIKREMENAFKLKVPLIVDLGEGKHWLDAH